MVLDELVTDLERLGLKRHLLFDIRCNKDVLKIHPLSLSFNPFLNDLHDKLNIKR